MLSVELYETQEGVKHLFVLLASHWRTGSIIMKIVGTYIMCLSGAVLLCIHYLAYIVIILDLQMTKVRHRGFK